MDVESGAVVVETKSQCLRGGKTTSVAVGESEAGAASGAGADTCWCELSKAVASEDEGGMVRGSCSSLAPRAAVADLFREPSLLLRDVTQRKWEKRRRAACNRRVEEQRVRELWNANERCQDDEG